MIMENIEELKKQLTSLQEEKHKAWEEYMGMAERDVPFEKAWNWYIKQPAVSRCDELERKIRNMEEYTLEPLDDPDWCDHMPIEEFMEGCRIGPLFTDDDGFGYYAPEEKQTNIKVYPSDIISGNYRKDFSYVVWYNK